MRAQCDVTVGVLASPFPSYIREMYRALTVHARCTGRWKLYPMTDRVSTARHRIPPPRLDGMIGYFGNARSMAWAKRLRIPIVNISSHDICTGLACVRPDNDGIGKIAAITLSGLGLRHFAFYGYADAMFSHWRQQAFARELAARGFACAVATLAPEGIESARQRRRLGRWLQSLQRPCGLFVVGDSVAINVMREVEAIGLRIPDDIAVLSVDNEESVCTFSHPSLSSIPVPGYAIGAQAAILLDRLMCGEPYPDSPILVPSPEAILRDSTQIIAPGEPVVAEAMRYIRIEAPQRVLGPEDVARHVKLSRRTLDRVFQRVLHTTPRAAIDRVRLEQLKGMLCESNDLIKQIAYRMQFSSTENMTRFFRRMTGMSPSDFRLNRPAG